MLIILIQMGNLLGIICSLGRTSPATDNRSSVGRENRLTFATSETTSTAVSAHMQQRVSSVDHLEKLTELHNCIVTGNLNEFKKCLAAFSPRSVDVLFPSRLVSHKLISLDPHNGFCRSNPPVSLCLLHVAASRGRPDMLELLLRAGASPNVLDSNGESALHHAAMNPGFYRALYFHCCSDHSRLIIRWACGSHNCIEMLCSVPGVDVNICSRLDRATPLHRACEAGRSTTVAVLLAHEANPNALNEFGETPAAMALIAGHESVFQRFLDMGIVQGRLDAVPYILHTAVNVYGESPNQDRFNNIMGILQYNVNLNEQDQLGNTPLHYAAAGCMVDFQLISTLLTRGSNADLENKMGRTALMEFFFSHQVHTNNANIKSVVLLASYMTTTPVVPPGQSFASIADSALLWPRLYREMTDIIRQVSRRVPSLSHLCRQSLRRAVGPHRLGEPCVMSNLPLPTALREDVARRVDPESFCGYLVDFLLEREFPNSESLMTSLGVNQAN